MLTDIYQRIEKAKEASPSYGDVTVVAVIKNQPTEAANELIQQGIGIVAENRVQALRDRGDGLLPSKRHIIGHLQTNKVKLALTLADMIQSVDSLHPVSYTHLSRVQRLIYFFIFTTEKYAGRFYGRPNSEGNQNKTAASIA